MARNTPSRKKNTGKSGENRSVVLALAGFTALVAAVIVGVAVLNTTQPTDAGDGAGSFTPNDAGLIPTGREAPRFTASTVEGEKVSAGGSSSGAPATMLVFFASWCPHCQNEAPIISDLEKEHPDLKMVMIGIDDQQGDNPEKVRQFVKRYDIESPALYKPSLGPKFKVLGYPTTYVLDGDGKIVGAHSGEAPREVYERWIEKAL